MSNDPCNDLVRPNSTQVAEIERCQTAATTAYCWPPNGTRICVPSGRIPFFWPQNYYNDDARIAIGYDSDIEVFLSTNNTGEDSEFFTQYMFSDKSQPVLDKPDEKAMPLYFLELRSFTSAEPFSTVTHMGPTITLVKTAESTTTSSRTSSPTDTRPSIQSSFPDRTTLKPEIITGIVLGVIFAILVGLGFCCTLRRSKKKREDMRGTQWPGRRVGVGMGIDPRAHFADMEIAQQQRRERRRDRRRQQDDEHLPPYTMEQLPPNYAP